MQRGAACADDANMRSAAGLQEEGREQNPIYMIGALCASPGFELPRPPRRPASRASGKKGKQRPFTRNPATWLRKGFRSRFHLFFYKLPLLSLDISQHLRARAFYFPHQILDLEPLGALPTDPLFRYGSDTREEIRGSGSDT